MRVLLTTDTVGGVWSFTRELTLGLLGMGHAVALVSFGRVPSEDQESWCSAMAAEHRGEFRYVNSTVPLEWMHSNERSYVGGMEALLRLALAFRADVVHSNQFCYGKLPLDVPKVITAHSDVLSWSEACRPSGLESSEWLETYRALVQDGLDGADRVIAPTRWMLDALGRQFRLEVPSDVIYNGRTLSCAGIGQAKMQAVSVGRVWDEAKNLGFLDSVHAAMPLLIAGEIMHEEATVPDRIGTARLLGPLDEAEILKLLCTSSVYLALSIYEPFGLAPLEAALCGCAVVAHDIASLREVWGEGALYFRDASELEALLWGLQHSPALLMQARKASYRRALEFSALRMTTSYVALYEELIAERGANAPFAGELIVHGS